MSAHFTKRGSEFPSAMPDHADTHEAYKSKGVGYKTRRVFHNHMTSNNYEDSLVFDMRLFKSVLIHIKEIGGTNAIKYNVLTCLDAKYWESLKSDQAILAGKTAIETVSDAWNWIKIQVASNVAGSSGKVDAFIEAKTP